MMNLQMLMNVNFDSFPVILKLKYVKTLKEVILVYVHQDIWKKVLLTFVEKLKKDLLHLLVIIIYIIWKKFSIFYVYL